MGIRHILRRLLHLPVFTGVAVFTLAIGIGANTAMFSVVYGILLKPLPYPGADELIAVDHAAPGVNLDRAGIAPFLYFTYRDESRTLADVGMWRSGTMTVTGLATPEETASLFVTDGVLRAVGIPPLLGRLFTPHDDSPGSPETVILTAGYWRSTFGGDPSAVGRSLTLDGRLKEIVGVMPDSFRFLDRDVSLILPLRLDRNRTFLGEFSYSGIARLEKGVTLGEANADLARLIPAALRRFPPFPGTTVEMFEQARLAPVPRSLKDGLVGEAGTTLWVLMGTIGVVLLIACANVANLLLVRAEGRQQELAIRAALGASRARLARELLTESVTLGLCGGVAGAALAYGGVRWLLALAPGNLPRLEEIAIDAPVLLFTLAISIAAGLLFGAIPVLKHAAPRVVTGLRAGGRTASDSRERHRTRSTLVVVQVALALMLLVGSMLMIRTFLLLKQVAPGFSRPQDVLTLRISIPESQVPDPVALVRMQQRIADAVAAVPGVTAVGLASTLPMDGSGWNDPVWAADHAYRESQIPALRRMRFVGPGYLATLGRPIMAGRDFTWTDVHERRPVALVSENLARELWRDPRSAIGKQVRPITGPWREVVGVVADGFDDGVDQKPPTVVYWPIFMSDFGPQQTFVRRSLTCAVRSSRARQEGFLAEVSDAVWSVNPNLPLAGVRTLQQIYERSMARTSFALVMLAMAGTMALLLGVAGIYGVISYAVSQRRREIGIRIALGAKHREVTGMFVGHGVRLAAVGVACGLAAAAGASRLLASLLFNVSPVDPATYAGVAAGLLAVAALASYLPALRASTVDPVDALRAE